MHKVLAFLGIAGLIFSLACTAFAGRGVESLLSDEANPQRFPVVVEKEVIREVVKEAPAAMAAPRGSRGVNLESAPSATVLETAQRKVISVASITVQVDVVKVAIAEVRAIAVSLGGFVEQLSSSGGPERQRATMTIRVPQGQFTPAVERIEALGKVQNTNLGSEDVSNQFIDLKARLKSLLREEESLLSLLERTGTVTEILTIERELTRVRSDIERFQGQLNFLERRVDLATINVSLVPPEELVVEPPSATLAVEVTDVTGSVDAAKALVASLDGVVDRVLVSVRDDREKADLTLRVFTADFKRAMDFLEGQGKVKSKDLREGTPPEKGGSTPAEKPDARIDVSFAEESTSVDVGLIVGIIVGVVLASLLVLAFYGAYRFGIRRQRSSS